MSQLSQAAISRLYERADTPMIFCDSYWNHDSEAVTPVTAAFCRSQKERDCHSVTPVTVSFMRIFTF